MGWTAVQGSIGFQAWWLFCILFLWQLPHFLAIGWLYREDYARGGFPMLPVTDTDCVQTSRQVIINTIALIAVSLLPAFVGLSGKIYLAGAVILGILFLMMGIRLSQTKSSLSARQLLVNFSGVLASIVEFACFGSNTLVMRELRDAEHARLAPSIRGKNVAPSVSWGVKDCDRNQPAQLGGRKT